MLSDSSSEEEENYTFLPGIGKVVPYEYDPLLSEDEALRRQAQRIAEELQEEAEAISSPATCECGGHCEGEDLKKGKECCRWVAEVNKLCAGPGCLTQVSEEFKFVCLGKRSLLMRIRQENDDEEIKEDEVQSRQFRYQAYRNASFFLRGPMGKWNRRELPSCVVQAIRRLYPDPHGNYTGFLEKY